VVPRYASRLFLLAALLWVGFAPSAFAVRAPSVSALVPSENRVGGSGQFASGRLSIEDQQSPINTPGLEGCGYETASGRLKWLNRDPIEEEGGINLYGHVANDPINYFDPDGHAAAAVIPVVEGGLIIGGTIVIAYPWIEDALENSANAWVDLWGKAKEFCDDLSRKRSDEKKEHKKKRPSTHDKHTKKRPGAPEKKDERMPYRR